MFGWGDYTLTLKAWIWSLPPAIETLEEIGMGRLKCHASLLGIVFAPNLLSLEWRRKLLKATDFHFIVQAGWHEAWPVIMHEGLTVTIFLLLLRHEPWL